jgi:hypothetical protein
VRPPFEKGARAAWLLSCALAATVGAPARAQEQTPAKPRDQGARIAVLCAPGDRFGLRVIAELESLGLAAVQVEPGEAPASRVALEAAARKVEAIAAIRAVPAEGGVEVWIADRVTGKTVLRAVSVAGEAADPDAALALRAVELLRASLLETALPAARPGEVPATPDILTKMALPSPAALAPPEPPVFRLALGLGPLLSPGGLAPAAALDAGLAWMPSDHFGATLFAAIPLSRPAVMGTPGRVDLAAGVGGVGARFLLTTRASRWAPTIDAGLAVFGLQATGSANPGFASGQAFAAMPAPYLQAGLAFAPTPRLRVRADVLGSLIVGGTSIRLAGTEAATWGQPVALVATGVDVGLF